MRASDGIFQPCATIRADRVVQSLQSAHGSSTPKHNGTIASMQMRAAKTGTSRPVTNGDVLLGDGADNMTFGKSDISNYRHLLSAVSTGSSLLSSLHNDSISDFALVSILFCFFFFYYLFSRLMHEAFMVKCM